MVATKLQKEASREYYHKNIDYRRDRRMVLINAKLDKMLPTQYLYLKERMSILLRELPPHFLSGWGTTNYMSGTVMYVCYRDGFNVPNLNALRNEFEYSNKRFWGNKFYKKLKMHFKYLQDFRRKNDRQNQMEG